MTIYLGTFALAATQILADSSSDDGGGGLGLLFLLSGFVFYGYVYIRYRNVDKRHKHESETEAEMHNVQGRDQFVQSKKGLSSSTMAGANNKDVRGSQRRFFG